MTASSTNGHVNSLAEAAEAMAPPHSRQAEEAVLGSVLKNGLAIADVAAVLKPEHFYDRRYRRVYAAMYALPSSIT